MFSARTLFKTLWVTALIPMFLWAPSLCASEPSDMQKKPSLAAVTWVKQAESDVGLVSNTNELANIYEYFSFSPIWHDYRAKDELETQINIISLAGLSENFEWRAVVLRDLRSSGDWRAYDVFATDSLLALISYIESIPDNGKSWFFGTDITESLPSPTVTQTNKLIAFASRNKLYRFVFELRPSTSQYKQMAKAIVKLQDDEETYWPKLIQRGLIRPGDKLDNADSLITNLERQGVLSVTEAQRLKIEQVSFYNAVLSQAVKRFQARHGLKEDGVIGDKTRRWLNKSAISRIQILALNMERLRLWPTERQKIILVNIPNYEMELWIDSEMILDSKVVVGRPSRRTPLFDSRLDSVVFNPSWNVPVTIMRKDILPKARQDNEYLVKHSYTVLSSWVNGSVIPHEDIDWENVTARNFPYRLQQSPGNFNALGRYKFNTPNGNAIYLHDTPAKSLFNKESRAFSSGCIRVQKAEILAQVLLNRSGLEFGDYDYYRRIPETKWVSLRQKIAVHTIYQTAWVNEDGEVQFRNDVYHYDARPKRSTPLSASLTAKNL
ncbi:peptidoglycan-binding protein [Enterovibrio norvegicus FF-454]|uniref:Peptidoglycan-binding protein n=1 Tax=Enterovibrio norvegicus FF-454 TaxID=1185651 RepID=A0A1E5BY21_9GAMM|nr:L,D-transpeptidase family protein [Enterovibrio norvegicus]OEE58121.1 peptidoglycan-binding protein [Enterovibrio norvegicus FF-454]